MYILLIVLVSPLYGEFFRIFPFYVVEISRPLGMRNPCFMLLVMVLESTSSLKASKVGSEVGDRLTRLSQFGNVIWTAD